MLSIKDLEEKSELNGECVIERRGRESEGRESETAKVELQEYPDSQV